MKNNQIKTYIDENGNKIVLEEIMTFEIQELGKKYMAFTINDDGKSNDVCVNLVELVGDDINNLHIKKIEEQEEELVKSIFSSML